MIELIIPEQVRIADIAIRPDRARSEMGDLEGLAVSIREDGLLQPIAVTPRKVLLWGERRLRAALILEEEYIPAFIIDVADDLDAMTLEWIENMRREQFTLSDRVRFARKLKALWGDRRGQRTDLARDFAEADEDEAAQEEEAGEADSASANGTYRQMAGSATPLLEVQPGESTHEAAARHIDTSPTTLARAEKVVACGVPELVKAMDDGLIPPARAVKIAELPPKEQKQAVAEAREGKPKRAKVQKNGAEKKGGAGVAGAPVLVDAWGIPVQPHAQEAFAQQATFDDIVSRLRQCAGDLGALTDGPAAAHLLKHLQWTNSSSKAGGRWSLPHLDNAITVIESCKPAVTDCPYAYNDEAEHPESDPETGKQACPLCHGVRWLAAVKGRSIPKKLVGAMKERYGVALVEA